MSTFYVAVLETNSEGEIFAHLPDLPGVTASAATAGETLALATEFANDHVRDLVDDGHPVPPARAIQDIPLDPEAPELIRALIPVEVPGKSVKISLSIDEALLTRIDRAAAKAGMSRSGLFAAACDEHIRVTARSAPHRVRDDGEKWISGALERLIEATKSEPERTREHLERQGAARHVRLSELERAAHATKSEAQRALEQFEKPRLGPHEHMTEVERAQRGLEKVIAETRPLGTFDYDGIFKRVLEADPTLGPLANEPAFKKALEVSAYLKDVLRRMGVNET